jgi:hypothetical protein
LTRTKQKMEEKEIDVVPCQTFTITFGNQGENHVGMQKIGADLERGLTVDEVREIGGKATLAGYVVETHRLNSLLGERVGVQAVDEAEIVVVRNGLAWLLEGTDDDVDKFFWEQYNLDKDKHALMYGRVVNKKARHNLCFADFSQEPNYEKGQGRVYAFADLPLLSKVRAKLGELNPLLTHLIAEGNYYYDPEKCGIGYHGDTERKIVIGVRVGSDMPLCFQWYYHGEKVGQRKTISLSHGDVYFSSAKAVGYDWKKKTIYTLRHAAGCKEFTEK